MRAHRLTPNTSSVNASVGMFSSFSSSFPSSFSLPDLKQVLHAQLSSAVGHVFDLEALSQEQFDARISGLRSVLTLRDVALNPGVRVGGGDGASSPPSSASSVMMQTLPGGRVGHFSVSIPLSTLVRKTHPIEVCLRDLEVVVGLEDWVGAEVARVYWEAERRRLIEREVMRELEKELEREGGGEREGGLFGSMLKRLISMGVSRLRLRVEGVRIRVVDMKSARDIAVCHVDGIETVEEDDSDGEQGEQGHYAARDRMVGIPSPLSDLVEGLVRHGSSKVLRLKGVGVWWCAGDGTDEQRTHASMDCTLHVIYALTSSPSQIMCQLRLESVEAALDMEDAADILALMEDMEWRAVRRRVAHLRPPPMPTPESETTGLRFDAKEMWRFAINSVLFEMVGPVRFAAWRPEEQVLRDRRRYILLYRKMHDVRASMSSVGENEIARLERLLSVSDVVTCRTVAMRSADSDGRRPPPTAGSVHAPENERESIDTEENANLQGGVRPVGASRGSSRTTNPKSSVMWSKIPALVEIEERLFQALDIESQENFASDHGDGDAVVVLPASKIQFLATLQLPRATLRVRSHTFRFDGRIIMSDSMLGYISDVSDDVDVSSMPAPPVSSPAYAMASVRHFEVTTPRNTLVRFKSPLRVEYMGLNNVIRVDMAQGVDARVAPEDIRALVDCIPVASPESYSLHWIETAISMEKKAYCIETVRRLQRLGNFVDFDVRIGRMELTVEGLDIRIGLDMVALRTAMESDNFEELRKIYRIISSFDAAADAATDRDTPMRSAMHMLEDRLIYREVDVTLANFSVEYDGIPVVHPLQGTARAKINRLYGDFSHPQIVAELALGEVSVDMFDACLSSLIQLQDALATPEVAPGEAWTIQRTISAVVGWETLRLRWLAGGAALRHQFSVHAGQSSVRLRVCFPQSRSTDVSLEISDFKVLHSKGMESIDIPMAEVQIPYFARSFSLDCLTVEMKDRPQSTDLRFESSGILLAGDGKDASNYVRSTTRSDASIRASFVQRDGEAASLRAFVSSIDIGHGTLMRAMVISQALTGNGDSPPAPKPPSGAPMDLRLDLVLRDIRCSFVHDMAYGRVSGTPVQYHDFSAIHSSVAQVRLARLDLQCDLGEKSSIRLLELDSLSTRCGMLGEKGAILGVIFDLPQIRCQVGDTETLLDCPEINGGISPYQVTLLKGISDLIAFDQSRYDSFYAVDGESQASIGGARHPGPPVAVGADLASLDFDPIRVALGSLNICIVGSLPSAGSVWLRGRSIEVGARPGNLRLVWQTFDVSHWLGSVESTSKGRTSNAGDSTSGSSDGDSDSSAVVFHDVARTLTGGSSNFFDAVSVVSRGLSESSLMSSFYSADEGDAECEGSPWDPDDGVTAAPPMPDDESLSSIAKLSFEGQLDMGAVLNMVTDQHMVASLSPIQLEVGLDAVGRLVHFLRTFERYLSNHILADATCIPHGDMSDGGTAGARHPVLRELVVDMERITLLLETAHDQDTLYRDTRDCDGVTGSSFEEKPETFPSRASCRISDPLRHVVALSLGARLKCAHVEAGQACSLDLYGLLVSAFPIRGDSGDLSPSLFESHALVGNRHCSIKGSWSPEAVNCDIECSQVTAWFTDLNILPARHVITKCHASVGELEDGSLAVAEGTGPGDLVIPRDPAGAWQLASCIDTAKFSMSIHRVSIVVAAHALSRQNRHLCELGVNNVSIAAHSHGGVLSASASVGIEAAACRVSDGLWIAMLDETRLNLVAAVPLDVAASSTGLEAADLSDAVRVSMDVEPANLTVNRDIIESMAICSMLADGLVAQNEASSPAPYLTLCQLVNETNCRLCVALDDESSEEQTGVHVVEPGASLFPRQAASRPYKACIPDAELGATEVGPGRRPATSACLNRRAYVCIEREVDRHAAGSQEAALPGAAGVVGIEGTPIDGWISLKAESTLYRSFKGSEIALHTSKSLNGTWKTRVRPCIRFRNYTDVWLEVARPGCDQILAAAEPRQEVWLPVSAAFGEYVFRTSASDWCDSVLLTRTMASRGYSRQMDVVFRAGASVISIPLTISGECGSVNVTASPKLDICNLVPVPVDWNISADAPPLVVRPGCRRSVPDSMCNFPLHLAFSPVGFSDVKRVVVNEIRGVPVLKWNDEGWNDYTDALDVTLAEKPSGAGDLYGRLTASKDAISGTVVVSLVAPVWVYNYAGVPISFDCLMESSVAEASIRPGGGISDVVLASAAPIDRIEDVVPDIWISPLELHPSKNDGLGAVTSIHAPDNLSGLECSRSAVDADQGLALTSPVISTGLSTGYGAGLDASLLPSPSASVHYCMTGLGSLVAHTPKSLAEDSGSVEEVESFGSLLRHSRVSERFYVGDDAVMRPSAATNPSGLNSLGARMMSHAVKKLRLRVTRQKASPESSYWSSPVSLDAHRRQDVVAIPLPPVTAGMQLYNTRQGEFPVIISLRRHDDVAQQLSLSVDKLIVSPQFLISNELGTEILYKQQGTFVETRIPSGGYSAVKWTDVGLPRKLSVRIQEPGWMWSGGFSLDNAGDMFLKLRHRDRGVTDIVRAEISHSSEDGTKRIVLRSNPLAFTPYRLDNCSLETLTVRQKGVLDQQDVLRPYCSLNYTWDEPSMAHQITLERPGGQAVGSFDFDKVGFEEVIGFKRGSGLVTVSSRKSSATGVRDAYSSDLVVRVTAEGPVRVLTIMDLGYHERYPLVESKETVTRGKGRDSNEYEVHLNIDGISLSIVHLSKERLYFGVRKVAMSCMISSSRMAVSGSIRFVSLENTSHSCVYPVIFSLPAPESTLSSRVRKGVGESDPLRWGFTLWRDFRELHNIACFDVADIYVRSFSVYIEQDLINLFMEMSASGDWSLPSRPTGSSNPDEHAGPIDMRLVSTSQIGRNQPASASFPDLASLTQLPAGSPEGAPLGGLSPARTKFYFDRISVSPVEFMISFNSSMSEDWNNWSAALLQQVIALADIEDARVWLSGIHLSNTLFDGQTMVTYISTHYRRALILEIFKLVGAANVLGDPMATIQHVGLGFWEFFSFSAAGLLQSCKTLSPTDFVLGCVQGTKGLLQNVLFAVSNATTKASSAARKTIRLTWGDDSGSNPSESILGATLRGMIGMVTEPVKGAEDGGLSGFLVGIRHGALGAVLIPASAWLQMCAGLALSIRKAVAGTANVGWSRPPRANELLPYDWTDSMGQWLFRQLKVQRASGGHLGVFDASEEYVCCSRLMNATDGSMYLILTTKHVLAARAEGLNWTPKVVWSSRLAMLEVVTSVEDTEGTSGLRLVSNPELAGSPGLRRREERMIFSVFKADFAHPGLAVAWFWTQLDTCRDKAKGLARLSINHRVV